MFYVCVVYVLVVVCINHVLLMYLNVSVVVAYAPTEGASDNDKDEFYQQLSSAFDELPRHDLKLLLGDLNAKVTSDCSSMSGVIGGHSLHSSSNDNGTRLLDFCIAHQLTIGGTMFQQKDIHKGTWRSSIMVVL